MQRWHPASINPTVLVWARRQNDLTTEQAARRLGTSARRWEKWESGERRPTFTQATAIAKKLHLPFGYLFASKPPQSRLTIPGRREFHSVGTSTYRCQDTCRSRLVQLTTCVYRCPECRSLWWIKRARGGSPAERVDLYDLPYPAGQAIAYLVDALKDEAPPAEGAGTR